MKLHLWTIRIIPCLVLLIAVSACRNSPGHAQCAPGQRSATTASEDAAAPASQELAAAEAPGAEAHDRRACDGKPVLNLEERSADGFVFRKYQAVQGDDGSEIPHGVNTLFYPTGQKKLEASYVCGVAHGPRTAWYQDGKSRSKGENIDGKNHGVWTVWFPDGNKSQEFTMDHGAWHGTYTTWHPSGQKRMQVEYVHGLQQGPLEQFDESGVLLRSVDQVDGIPQPMPGGRVTE